MNSSAHIVPPSDRPEGAYERAFRERLAEMLTQHAGELARLGWLERRRRKAELRRWIEADLSSQVRAGKLPPKRSTLASDLFGPAPVIH